VFIDVLHGWTLPMQFIINGTPYNIKYYLADDIYPDWVTFVKTIQMLQGEKTKLFVKCQRERKDVERSFGVLKSWFVIICGPLHNWQTSIMKNIILTCIILYDMIGENERDTYNGNIDIDNDHISEKISNIDVSHDIHSDFIAYMQIKHYMHTREIHQWI